MHIYYIGDAVYFSLQHIATPNAGDGKLGSLGKLKFARFHTSKGNFFLLQLISIVWVSILRLFGTSMLPKGISIYF